MNTKFMNDEDFNWDELLDRIKNRSIIPVIGQSLYWINLEKKKNVLLYDHLADILACEIDIQPPEGGNHKFEKTFVEYLKKKNFTKRNYLQIGHIIDDIIRTQIALVPLFLTL